MSDPSPPPEASPPGAPRWLKLSGIIVAALVVVIVILAVTGVLGGQHGPGRHLPGGGRSPAGVPGHSPPPGHGP